LLAPDSKSKSAGRRRSKGSASPSVSANKREMLNRSHLPLALDRLKRVQEYRRRRQDLTSGRGPTPIASNAKSALSSSARDSPTPSSTLAARPRPWLSPVNAARAEGVPRRRWLDQESKLRRLKELARKYNLSGQAPWSGPPLPEGDHPTVGDEALFHAFVQRQKHEEVENEVVERAEALAKEDRARASVTKALQVAVYPPDQPQRDLVQIATAQGLLADAGTFSLPWDPEWDATDDDSLTECQLNSITETGDVRPGWSNLFAAASVSRAPPQRRVSSSNPTPTLLLFWAYIAGTRVKVLVDSGCSTNIIAAKTLRSIPYVFGML